MYHLIFSYRKENDLIISFLFLKINLTSTLSTLHRYLLACFSAIFISHDIKIAQVSYFEHFTKLYSFKAALHRILNRMKSKTGNPITGAFCKQHFIRVCIVCYDREFFLGENYNL